MKIVTNALRNKSNTLKPIAGLIIIFLISSLGNAGVSQIIDSSKMLSTEVKTFRSKILREDRKLFIRTPSKMKTGDKFPVVYLLDGDAHIGMVGGQVQYLSESYMVIPNLIVVGISNTDRIRDLTPTHSIIGADGKPDTSANAFGKTSGGGEKFLQFIKEELMPYINTAYPTAPYNILSGHSLGGLMAVHCMVNHPDYFNAYIAISPSLQWDNDVILEQVEQKLNNLIGSNKIMFFSDANEDEKFHNNQLKLDSIFKRKKIAGVKVKYAFYPEETHISEPVKAFYDGIRHIYPNWYLPYNSSAFKQTMSSAIIINHYVQLSKQYNYKVVPPHDEFIQIARFLRKDPKRIKDAIELLKINADNYPNSQIVYDHLGDTYMMIKDDKNALTSYQKALALDLSNETIKQKISKLSN